MKNDNKITSKFNIMDAIIIVLILACLTSIIFRAMNIDDIRKGTDLEEYRVYFKIDDIKSTSVDYFISGDTVRLKTGNVVLGTLEGIVQNIPAVGAYNENGQEIFYPDFSDQTVSNDTRYSVSGNIIVKGKMTDNGFLLGGDTYLMPNTELSIVTEHIDVSVKVISITPK